MAPKKRTTKEQAAPKRRKRQVRGFPLLRHPLYNPRFNPPYLENVQEYFKGKSIEEIVKDRDLLFYPFFLYSQYVVDEIYKLMKTPSRSNTSLLRRLFDRIIPRNPRNLAKALHTTRLSCIITPEIMNRNYPPWGTRHRRNIQRVYAEGGNDVKGVKGKPINVNSLHRLFYDAKKEFKLFEPGLKGSTREEKLDDFLKMLQEFVNYHTSNDAPLTSLALEIWDDALKKGRNRALK